MAVDWIQISHYVIAAVMLPVSVLTVKSVIQNAGTIFDDDLTLKDRGYLKQLSFFVILPLIVLFHELGHAVACKLYHADIVSFNWSLFWGQVAWKSAASSGAGEEAPAIIALAGNLFELAACLFALILARFEKAPAIVALSIYVYVLTGFHVLLAYPILSLAAWNDDFSIIYGYGKTALPFALTHILLAAAFIYSFTSSRCRLAFVKKTRPTWAKDFEKVKEHALSENTAMSYLALAWQYYLVGLDRLCEETLKKVESLDQENYDVWLLRGYINQSKGKYNSAVLCFEEIIGAKVDIVLKTRALMAKGHCLYEQLLRDAKQKDFSPVVASYRQAIEGASDLADPHYYLGVTLLAQGDSAEAEKELTICQNAQNLRLTWLDPLLANLARQELGSLRNAQKRK